MDDLAYCETKLKSKGECFLGLNWGIKGGGADKSSHNCEGRVDGLHFGKRVGLVLGDCGLIS